MRGSLQEQLLKAGLVKNKSSVKPKKRAKPKTAKSPNSPNKLENISRKPLADNELEKSVKLEIKKLLKENRFNIKDGELPFNYSVGSQIKRCYITQEQMKSISNGEISIVNWNDRSYLIPNGLIAELQTLHPDLRFFNASESQSESDEEIYKDYPIPDDLSW